MQKRTLLHCGAGVVAGLVLLSLPVCAAKWRVIEFSGSGQQGAAMAAPDTAVPGTSCSDGKGEPLTKQYFPPMLPAGARPTLAPVAPDKRTESGQPKAAAYIRDPSTIYIAQKGDTLAGVASKLGVDTRTLAHLNGFTTTKKKLMPGQTLRLPARRKNSVPDRRGGYGGRSMVQSALQYWGTPYRWAGTTSRGMDCSGLVKRVLANQGVDAPHNAAQLYQLGIPVDVDDLQSGDLVFFGNTYRAGVSHVGIYAGGGQFIHASSSHGAVTVSGLSERYYKQHYVGARRIR